MAVKTEGKYENDVLSFGQSFINNLSHLPIIGNEIYNTYDEMMTFVSGNPASCIGTILTVVNETNSAETGAYLVLDYNGDGKVLKINSAIEIDSAISLTSTNAVQNQAITSYVDNKIKGYKMVSALDIATTDTTISGVNDNESIVCVYSTEGNLIGTIFFGDNTKTTKGILFNYGGEWRVVTDDLSIKSGMTWGTLLGYFNDEYQHYSLGDLNSYYSVITGSSAEVKIAKVTPSAYLTQAEYNSLSDEDKNKDIEYNIIPDESE